MGFHICQHKKSNRKILSQGLPYMLAEEVKPEDTLPGLSIQKKSNRQSLSQGLPYVSRSSQTGRYSPRGFHICQQKKSNRKFISQGLPYMLGEVDKQEDTLPGSSIYVSGSSQTGIYSPMGFHIYQQKKSNRNILTHGLPFILAEEVKPEDNLPVASIYVSRRSQTGRCSPKCFHICQQKKSNRKILSQGLPYMLAEEVNRKILSQWLPYVIRRSIEPEDTLPGASIYVSRSSRTGRYSPRASIYVSRRSQTGSLSPRGFHICQQKQSNRKILSQGLPYMLAEVVKPEYTLPWASIYVSRRSQTGRCSPKCFHICQQKKSNRKILSQGLPYMLAEEVKPEYTHPGASIYVSRRSQTGRYSPMGFHICQQKKSNRKILSPYRRSQTGRASIYVSRRSQTGRYSPRGFHICQQKQSNRNIGSSIYVSRSQTGRYSPMGFHICQQKKSNRKMLSQVLPYMLAEEVKPEVLSHGLPYMLAEEVKPEDTLPVASVCYQKKSDRKILSQGLPYMLAEVVEPEDTLHGASIYVSRRSQTGSLSPRGFHICQQKQSNRKILSQGLPYMLAEVVKPEYTLPWASIYVSRRSQTGRCSPKCFHICQQKKSNRKILSQGLPYMLAEEVKPEDTLPGASIYVSRRSQTGRYSPSGFHICQQKKSNRKMLSQGLPYMLAEDVKPEDTLPGASIYVSRRSQTGRYSPSGFRMFIRRNRTGRYSPRGFHICQQKQSNRKILSTGLPYMLAEEVKPEVNLPWASIYVSRSSRTGRYSPRVFHICQQKQSNRNILSHGLPYMLAEEVKPEDTLPRASIYVSRRSQTGRYSPRGFHICQQKKSNRKILSQWLPYVIRRNRTGRYSPRGFHTCQQKQSNRKILSKGLPYMLAEEVKPEVYLPGASIYVSRSSRTGRYSPSVFHICQQKQSNRNILSHGLPYMLAEEIKPEYTLPWASIYFSRRSQTG